MVDHSRIEGEKFMSLIEAKKQKAMVPGKFRKYLRTNIIWQIIRFLIINYKMTLIILKSHSGENNKK